MPHEAVHPVYRRRGFGRSLAAAYCALSVSTWCVAATAPAHIPPPPVDPICRLIPETQERLCALEISAMGTLFRIRWIDTPSEYAHRADSLAQQAPALLAAIEQALSDYRARSEARQLPAQLWTYGAARPSAWFARTWRESMRWHVATAGRFDVTVGKATRLWRYHARRGSLPSEADLKTACQTIGMHRFVLEGDSLRLDRAVQPRVTPESATGSAPRETVRMARETPGAGVRGATEGPLPAAATVEMPAFDFGGIGKGIAADALSERMRAMGIARGIVDAGGDLLAWGAGPPQPGPPQPGATPRAPRGWMITLADGRVDELIDGAVATSGPTFRSVTVDGTTYSHIFDPITCQPSTQPVGVSVWARDATSADAMATAVTLGWTPPTTVRTHFYINP